MGMYRPLRGGLFVYELVRLAGLVWAAGLAPPAGEVAFPAVVYGAANALFLLMALFVLLDPVRYGAYVPLYTAGKVISVVSALGWCILSLDRVFNAIFMGESNILTVMGLLLCIALGDILSVCGAAALSWKLNKLRRMESATRFADAGTAIAVATDTGTAASEPKAANSDDL